MLLDLEVEGAPRAISSLSVTFHFPVRSHFRGKIPGMSEDAPSNAAPEDSGDVTKPTRSLESRRPLSTETTYPDYL